MSSTLGILVRSGEWFVFICVCMLTFFVVPHYHLLSFQQSSSEVC